MRTELTTNIQSDVLIVGSGLAGLLLAIKLIESGMSITLATKGALIESNTSLAQGGVAAVLDATSLDSPALHLADTLQSGAGLTDEIAAKTILDEGGLLISELCRLGVSFDKSIAAQFDMAREGGHSRARVLHSKDTTGLSITQSLTKALLRLVQQEMYHGGDWTAINIVEHAFATELIESDGRCLGADFIVNGDPVRVLAGSTVLATGGAGQLFSRTTNPPIATADGVALAYRAGARLIDLEFMQFHPTAFAAPGGPCFLISEAVRGAGALLLDSRGEQFARRFHKDGELATRDVVARAIHTIMQEQNCPFVTLDLRPIGRTSLMERFPNIVSFLSGRGIDPLSQPVPVAPAAHYFMGGIETTPDGCTSIEGLYAIGECAATGLHGANRLASNSLLEAGVMAWRLHRLIADQDKHSAGTGPNQKSSVGARQRLALGIEAHGGRGVASPLQTTCDQCQVPISLDAMRDAMFRWCSLVRSQDSLSKMQAHLDGNTSARLAAGSADIEAANLLLVARLMATAAEKRMESRGSHYREDFPTRNDALFLKRLAVESGMWSWLDVARRPVDPGLTRPRPALMH